VEKKSRAERSKCVVVVPVYRDFTDGYEAVSLKRCFEVLGEYDIVFVAPENLNMKAYEKFGKSRTEFFAGGFFSSVKAYSQLLTAPEFYERFLPYEFMLIHQLDVFVFSDELSLWCDKGYDYIGPPWTDTAWMHELGAKWRIPFLHKILRRTGNGGFSLRRVRAFYRFARLYRFATKRMKLNEDVIWSNHPLSFPPFFSVAPYREALAFGFEMHPERSFAENGYRLPFGVHAWQKHQPDFWRPFFADLGYAI
jgi:hypothetical protein